MSREIKLLVYHSPLFPAHWALFIPLTTNAQVGKLIQAMGDAKTGFTLEFVRNYNLAFTTRQHSVLPLAVVESSHVVDVPGNETESKDREAVDPIEMKALAVPVPGPSLRSLSSSESTTRVQIKNCQTWLRELVEGLIADGIFPPEALKALDTAPKN
ncbi:MAG: hypothetical protein Q9163_006178 [Psora crenata]